jgi:16S rRNA processing protein RimM
VSGAGGYLAVARLRKPHGLKGEAVVWTLTDHPADVLAAGRRVVPIDDDGRPTGPALVIERSRPYHRQWLVKFAEVADRTAIEGWRERLFGVPADELEAPADDELYVHEVPGVQVMVADTVIGAATGLVDVAGGRLLAVDVGGREVLVPFRRPIVTAVDRAQRTITIDPPAGLLEL